VARGSSPEIPSGRVLMIFLVYFIISCFIMCLYCLLALRDIFPTPMARYSLFVVEVPSKQGSCVNNNSSNVVAACFITLL